MEFIIINLLNGISMGCLLFLLAAGLSIVLGLMNILNLSHGAIYMIGAYIGWTMAVLLGFNFFIAVISGALVAGLLGSIINMGFLKHLHNQPNEQVLITFGFTYILINLSSWIWGSSSKAPFTTSSLVGSLSVMDFYYPKTRLAIIIIGLLLAIIIWWLQEKTRIGAIVRAGVDNKEMAMALGINVKKVSNIVFFISASIAGFAGVLGAQILGVTPQLGFDILLLALIVIVVGGLGSIKGALIGGLLIGIVDAFGKAIIPEFAMFTIYLFMVMILVFKPTGLMGRGEA